MEDCIFCKIASGTASAEIVYEDEHVIAFHDLAPQAPVHVLIIPKRHAENLLDVCALEDDLPSRLLRAATEVSKRLGVDKTGFRVVSNCGEDACQTVRHLHIHLLGGKRLSGTMA